MNKKKTLIIVIASALVVIIGIVALVLALRGKKQNTVVDNNTTTTVTESADITDSTSEEYATPNSGDSNEESGEGKTDSSNENSNENSGVKDDAPTNAPTKETTEEVTEPSGEKEEEKTEPVVDDPIAEGTPAPTVAPTQPVTAPPTEAPTPAPTEPPTEKPTEKPLTDKDRFLNCGGTYVANSDGTVSVDYTNVKGDVVIPNTIDGKKVVIEYADRWLDTTITSLYIDAEVIPEVAFEGCNGLVSVTLGPNVKVIGDNAFINCDNLTSVAFMGEGIEEIPDGFVSGCYKLTSLTIPRSVKRMACGAVPGHTKYIDDAYPLLKKHDPNYDALASAVVPSFTLYTYSEPGEIEVYYDNWISTAKCPETLEEMMEYIRRYNYSIVYLD